MGSGGCKSLCGVQRQSPGRTSDYPILFFFIIQTLSKLSSLLSMCPSHFHFLLSWSSTGSSSVFLHNNTKVEQLYLWVTTFKFHNLNVNVAFPSLDPTSRSVPSVESSVAPSATWTQETSSVEPSAMVVTCYLELKRINNASPKWRKWRQTVCRQYCWSQCCNNFETTESLNARWWNSEKYTMHVCTCMCVCVFPKWLPLTFLQIFLSKLVFRIWW